MATIDAISIPQKLTIKKTRKNRHFRNTNLQKIITDIANENNLTPVVEIEENIKINSLTQRNETDAQFIQKLAKKYGYYQKITPEKLFFIKQETLEKQPVIATLNENELTACNLEEADNVGYKKVIAYYFDHKKNKKLKYVYEDPNIKTGEILKINKKFSSLEEAKRVAIATLKNKNKTKMYGSISVEGNPLLVAGATIYLELKDVFSGKYFIEKSIHTIGQQGYITTLEIRKIQ
ncbi:MAG: hypothetical protein GXO21_05310 [Aquificae bacterium]|nr:hypothetical protein [Aquificota bacterium]